jgi:hypothetical protein
MMKRLQVIFISFLTFVVFVNFAITTFPAVRSIFRKPSNAKNVQLAQQPKQEILSQIIFSIPHIKPGEFSWRDTSVVSWLSNYCMDKCNDTQSSGYRFAGQITNTDKSYSLKVTVKTDKEYAQPVRFDPATGKFNGNVYFDKFNRMETTIKVMLRDSTNSILQTYLITLTE